jgi:L-arabinose isomerase
MHHEMEAVDVTTAEVIFANSGEHDNRFEAQSAFRYSPNPWFPGINRTPILSFAVAPGPASVVSMSSVKNRLRVIVAEGEFTERTAHATGTMSAVFRFSGSDDGEGWQSWVRAGSGHHSCATNQHIAKGVEAICRHLEIECARVGPYGASF